MAITFIGSGAAGGNVATLNLAWSSLSATPASGDVALLLWTQSSGSTVTTDPSGWTLQGNVTSAQGSLRTRVYSRICTGSESGNISGVMSGTNRQTFCVTVYRGVDNTAPVNAITSRNESATAVTSHACPAVTPTVGGCSIVSMVGERQSTGSTGYTTSWTKRVDTNSLALGSGGTIGAQADDGLATTNPSGTPVTPPDLVGTVASSGVTTWSLALLAASGGGGSFNGTASDAVSLSDALSRAVQAPRPATDAVTLADSTTRSAAEPRGGSDAISVADTGTATLAFAGDAADTVTLADTAARSVTTTRTEPDAVTSADSPDRLVVAARTAPDSVALADTADAAGSHARTTADAVTVADAAAGASGQANSGTDTLTLAETEASQRGFTRAATDPVALAEETSGAAGFTRSIPDALVLADATFGSPAQTRTAADSITYSDAAAGVAAAVRAGTDAIALPGQFGGVLVVFRAAVDAVVLVDQATLNTGSDADITITVGALGRGWSTRGPGRGWTTGALTT